MRDWGLSHLPSSITPNTSLNHPEPSYPINQTKSSIIKSNQPNTLLVPSYSTSSQPSCTIPFHPTLFTHPNGPNSYSHYTNENVILSYTRYSCFWSEHRKSWSLTHIRDHMGHTSLQYQNWRVLQLKQSCIDSKQQHKILSCSTKSAESSLEALRISDAVAVAVDADANPKLLQRNTSQNQIF